MKKFFLLKALKETPVDSTFIFLDTEGDRERMKHTGIALELAGCKVQIKETDMEEVK